MLVGDLWEYNFENLTGGDMELVHLGGEGETNWENEGGNKQGEKGEKRT